MGVGAEVYSNSVLVFRKRPGFHLATENDVPVLAFPLDRSGLEPAFQGAVELAFDRADAKEEHPLPALLEFDPGSPGLGEGEGVAALSALEAGVSRFLSRLDPPEEALEGFVHPLDDVL